MMAGNASCRVDVGSQSTIMGQETCIETKFNMPTELREVKFDYCGGVVTKSDSGSEPIKIPANGHVYVPSSELEKKGKFSQYVRAYEIIINEVDTGFIIESEDLKRNGKIVLVEYEGGELSTVSYPVSDFDILMLRIFRGLRGNNYPRGPGETNVYRPRPLPI